MLLRSSLLSFTLLFALNVANINGRPDKFERIVNGVDILIGKIPYQVYLRIVEFSCGGSILSKDWLLTAAHCTDGYAENHITFAVGVQDTRNINSYSEISKLIQHTGWNKKTFDNDISLLKVAVKLVFGPTVQPIKIQTTLPPEHSVVTASGYGDPFENAENPTFVLKAVDLKIMLSSICKQDYYHQLTDNMICAAVPLHDKDTCQGDSGGPLAYNGKLLGVVSYGYGCANNYPGVYVKVFNYLKWIKKNTGLTL